MLEALIEICHGTAYIDRFGLECTSGEVTNRKKPNYKIMKS